MPHRKVKDDFKRHWDQNVCAMIVSIPLICTIQGNDQSSAGGVHTSTNNLSSSATETSNLVQAN